MCLFLLPGIVILRYFHSALASFTYASTTPPLPHHFSLFITVVGALNMDSIRCFYFWIPVLLVCALIWILFRCFFSFFLLRSVVSLGFYAMDRSSFGLLVLGAKGNMGAWVCVFFFCFFFCSVLTFTLIW